MNVTQVVTIGRNVGSEPMSDGDWQAFKDAVASTLLDHHAAIIQRPRSNTLGDQCGVWEGRVTEEAAAFVALTPASHAYAASADLRRVCARFKQEAIGFIVLSGDEHLLRPTAVIADPYGSTNAAGFVVGV